MEISCPSVLWYFVSANSRFTVVVTAGHSSEWPQMDHKVNREQVALRVETERMSHKVTFHNVNTNSRADYLGECL